MRFLLAVFAITFHVSFLHSAEPSFKFTLGSNLGNVPFEINKLSKNLKKSPGININSWILAPNFSSFLGNKKSSNFSENKDDIYITFISKF